MLKRRLMQIFWARTLLLSFCSAATIFPVWFYKTKGCVGLPSVALFFSHPQSPRRALNPLYSQNAAMRKGNLNCHDIAFFQSISDMICDAIFPIAFRLAWGIHETVSLLASCEHGKKNVWLLNLAGMLYCEYVYSVVIVLVPFCFEENGIVYVKYRLLSLKREAFSLLDISRQGDLSACEIAGVMFCCPRISGHASTAWYASERWFALPWFRRLSVYRYECLRCPDLACPLFCTSDLSDYFNGDGKGIVWC